MDQTQNIYQKLLEEFTKQANCSQDLGAAQALRIKYLGKKGILTQLMQGLSEETPEVKREKGILINQLKKEMTSTLDEMSREFQKKSLLNQLAQERFDVTLPADPYQMGRLHPITYTLSRISKYFLSLGFSIAEGLDIEEDFYNFTALNITSEHPARQLHDTFYLKDRPGQLLRTHTSPVQIRVLQSQKPPLRIIVPGRVFRCDYDMTHTPMFHQIEGLVIEPSITMGHLKGCLRDFCETFFGRNNLALRFRPSYFPFTEPSAEVDIGYCWKNNQRLIGEGNQWMEVLGCGMVHPKVLENCGLDSQHYQGFAFGMGVERLAMLKYGIPDLRSFYESDTKWLHHYGFSPLQGVNSSL